MEEDPSVLHSEHSHNPEDRLDFDGSEHQDDQMRQPVSLIPGVVRVTDEYEPLEQGKETSPVDEGDSAVHGNLTSSTN